MGRSKDQWIAAHEKIGDDFAAGIIDRDEALARLRGLGFFADEANDQLDALEEESGA